MQRNAALYNHQEIFTNMNQQHGDQNGMPGRTDPNRPDQAPGTVPGKDAPAQRPPVPGQPSQPDRTEPGHPTSPNEPDRMPQPQA